MTPILALLAAVLIRVSPAILKKVLPILADANKRVWHAAYPIAVAIVKDLEDNGKLDGLDKHKAAIGQLEQQLIATGKFEAAELSKAHLGQIVLAAFFATVSNQSAA